jgi:hypothetical protein
VRLCAAESLNVGALARVSWPDGWAWAPGGDRFGGETAQKTAGERATKRAQERMRK